MTSKHVCKREPYTNKLPQQSTESVSYTHLDVYKRQQKNKHATYTANYIYKANRDKDVETYRGTAGGADEDDEGAF